MAGHSARMRDCELHEVLTRGEVHLQLPAAPPLLTTELARVLARILTKAGRARGVDSILEPYEPDALAS
jgi:hypothetical protein